MKLSEYFERQERGARSRLANAVGISIGYLYQIENGIRPVPIRRVFDIARATGWLVTPHDLKPGAYPNPSDGLPAGAAQPTTAE